MTLQTTVSALTKIAAANMNTSVETWPLLRTFSRAYPSTETTPALAHLLLHVAEKADVTSLMKIMELLSVRDVWNENDQSNTPQVSINLRAFPGIDAEDVVALAGLVEFLTFSNTQSEAGIAFGFDAQERLVLSRAGCRDEEFISVMLGGHFTELGAVSTLGMVLTMSFLMSKNRRADRFRSCLYILNALVSTVHYADVSEVVEMDDLASCRKEFLEDSESDLFVLNDHGTTAEISAASSREFPIVAGDVNDIGYTWISNTDFVSRLEALADDITIE